MRYFTINQVINMKNVTMYVAAEDIEAGIHKPKFQTEPTLPIYLKVRNTFHVLENVSYI
jgi:hypothetical protein